MDSRLSKYMRHIVEANDGTFVDGDDVALDTDKRDPRLEHLGAHLRSVQEYLRKTNGALSGFRRVSQLMAVLPESDPRRMNGLLAEIEIDLDTIGQAIDRVRPRLDTAIELVGDKDIVHGRWV